MAEDLARDLAQFTAELTLDRLPAGALAAAQNDLLDTMGGACAGARAPGVAELVQVLRDWGGKPESTVWSWDCALPAPAAALANGTMAHALDYADTHDTAVLHAGVSVIPAAIAAAQRRGSLSGTDLLAAVVAGVDVASRLAAATTEGPGVTGWLLTPLCGYFGAAAAAARALGLAAAQTRHAFGIAYAQAAGNGQATLDGALTKRMQAGLAARGGTLAACLAAAGITGAQGVLEGQRGYFRVYHRGNYDRNTVLSGLGRHFAITDLSYKPYPCCRWTHAAIDAALDLRRRGLTPDAVERVDIGVNTQAYNSTGQPLARKQRPQVIVDAQFSIPYSFATALTGGAVRLEDFTAAAITREPVLALAARVLPQPSEEANRIGGRSVSPALVTVHTRTGEVLTSRVTELVGSQGNPLRRPQLQAKFLDCCAFAGLDGTTARKRMDALLGIEGHPDATVLVATWAKGGEGA